MAYATKADIVAVYGADHLAGLLPGDEDLDADATIGAALLQAGGEVDLYLSTRFPLPLAVVPMGIRTAAIDIACYRLAVSHDRLTEEIKDRAKLARDLLKDIAAGRAGLGPAEPSAGDTGTSYVDDSAYFSSQPKRWGREGGLP